MQIIKNTLINNDTLQNSPTPQKNQNKKDSVWDMVKFIIFALIIVIPIRMFIAQPFLVKGRSMDPTFHDKDYLIVDELSYILRNPKRGEVIIFRFPGDPKEHFIKRVIGIPGDTIQIINGTVTVITKDGTTLLLDEPYVTHKMDQSLEDIIVPEGNLFVMGDNRSESYDSRMWKFLPIKLATGRALLRLYPFNDIDLKPGEHLIPQLEVINNK